MKEIYFKNYKNGLMEGIAWKNEKLIYACLTFPPMEVLVREEIL